MTTQFDLSAFFNKTFGFSPPPNYRIPAKGSDKPGADAPNFNIPDAPDKLTNVNGTPLYKTDFWGREYYLPINLGGLDLYFPVMGMEFKVSMVETAMTERTGKVKEIINLDDIDITIRGVIIRPDNQYPFNEINQLMAVCRTGASLTIKNVLTDLALKNDDGSDGNKVVVQSLSFPAVMGKNGAKPYELKLVSDTIFTLELV